MNNYVYAPYFPKKNIEIQDDKIIVNLKIDYAIMRNEKDGKFIDIGE